MSNYYTKQEAKVNIAHYLMGKGWEVLGYHKDESDMMTDYWSPASWNGIAIKNGFILVVDNNQDTKEYEVKKYNYNSTSYTDREKISKLEAMTQANGCTEGEETNAKELIKVIQDKESEGISEFEVIGVIPAHMGNPKGSIWHIEKNGKIYDKGNGLTKYADVPDSYMFDIDKMEFTESYKYYRENKWVDGELQYIKTLRTLSDNELKAVTDFKKLMSRLEEIANSEEKVTDGTAEGQQAATQAKNKEGYEKIIVPITKKVIKPIQKDNITINVNDVLSFDYHGHYWVVTNIYQNNKDVTCISYEMLGSAKRGYQRLGLGSLQGKRYYQPLPRLQKELDEGKTKVYTLQEVEETTDTEKWVKIDKSKKTYNSTPKTDKEQETAKTNDVNEMDIININNYDYTITEDTDTRDDSAIWVMKIQNKLDKDEYIKVSVYIKTLGGYYSKFKKGFIFKIDPSQILNINNTEETKQTTAYNEVAESIIDKSTDIITELEIIGKDITQNEQYKRQMEKYLKDNNTIITDEIINYLIAQENYNSLIDVLQEITSPYWQPEIKDGFIYNCYFKAWDIPITEIHEAVTALNIPFEDWGEKIGFKGITAEQARQVKEINDINNSMLFIDAEISETGYNNKREKEQLKEHNTDNITDLEQYKENKKEEAELMENNNTNEFNFNNILNKFDNVQVENNKRISADDEEFCITTEKAYKKFMKFADDYIQYLNNNSLSNILYNSQTLINEMNEEKVNKKDWFVSKIVNHFKDKYKVTLEYKTLQSKYNIDVNYNTIVDEVIEQLGGYNFTDKAEKEIKDEFKNTIRHDKISVKNKKISIERFFSIDSWDIKYGDYKVHYNSDSDFHKLFKAMSYFLFKSKENYFYKLYDTITREKNDAVFTTHEIANNGIKSLKLYKNGRIDLEFTSNEYLNKFAKEYCGYVEQAA